MSTAAFRAALIREVEQTMQSIDESPSPGDYYTIAHRDGRMYAYAHILLLLKDENDL